LNGKRVLDFCAGWGDRLIGALSCQEEIQYYYGVDPNPDLFPGKQRNSPKKTFSYFSIFFLFFSIFSQQNNMGKGYSEMVDTFTPSKEVASRFVMICEPFESCKLDEKLSFNLVFTGPPYYDYEKYGRTGTNQSITSFPNANEWMVNFLFASIEKSWNRLEEGGFLALNVNDVRSLVEKNIVYTEPMNLFIQYKLLDAKYEGVISFSGANMPLPRPTWVYSKSCKHIEHNKVNSARVGQLFSEAYPQIFKLLQK
jgi:hypothetical protein